MTNEFENRVYIREIKEAFNFKQITGNDDSLNRWVIVSDINRPGLELAGYLREEHLRRINIIGNKEAAYMKELDESVLRQRLEFITDSYTPCVIVAAGNEVHPLLLELANARNFPIFVTETKTYQLTVDMIGFLDEKLAKAELFHGELLQVKGVGVMIQGSSGTGKSEIAMELVKRGGYLVADDIVQVKKYHNRLFGEPLNETKGLLEIRGIGIIDIPLMFGAGSTLDFSAIHLLIKLSKFDEDKPCERVGLDQIPEVEVMGVKVPCIEIPVFEGRATTEVIESAVINYRLREKGINTAARFTNNLIDKMKRTKG